MPRLQAVLAPGGILASERCISAHVQQAKKLGAEVRTGEQLLEWSASGSKEGVTVKTDKGTYSGNKLVLAAGAWMPRIVPELQVLPYLSLCMRHSFCLSPVGSPSDAARRASESSTLEGASCPVLALLCHLAQAAKEVLSCPALTFESGLVPRQPQACKI